MDRGAVADHGTFHAEQVVGRDLAAGHRRQPYLDAAEDTAGLEEEEEEAGTAVFMLARATEREARQTYRSLSRRVGTVRGMRSWGMLRWVPVLTGTWGWMVHLSRVDARRRAEIST